MLTLCVRPEPEELEEDMTTYKCHMTSTASTAISLHSERDKIPNIFDILVRVTETVSMKAFMFVIA